MHRKEEKSESDRFCGEYILEEEALHTGAIFLPSVDEQAVTFSWVLRVGKEKGRVTCHGSPPFLSPQGFASTRRSEARVFYDGIS